MGSGRRFKLFSFVPERHRVAGDAFTAGLIHTWLLDDDSAREAGRFAAATAALNCTTTGARDTLSSESDVRAFLNDQ
nr:PfkB family carbohydrate kinase [Halobellus inordinatus]